MDSIPTELLELQTRFETWRASRKYVRESIPDELRSVDPSRLKKKPMAKRSAPTATALKKKPAPTRPTRSGVPKQKLKSSTRLEVATLHQPCPFGNEA